jgi:hypothetical protein
VVIIEPILNDEKIEQLLAEGSESEHLDYKTTLNLKDTCDEVEFAKDIAAMQVEGGYIVIGADNYGKPTGQLSEESAKLFDEAILRNKLKKYLPEPFDLRSCIYRRSDGNLLAAIGTLPHRDGFMIMKALGQYEKNKKQIVVFQPGDVFVRHGTASERWSQHDIERILARIIERRKEVWRADVTRSILEPIDTGQNAKLLTEGPLSALSWQLDAETFDNSIKELIRRKDGIALRSLLDRMAKDAIELIRSDKSGSFDELRTLLTRLVCLSAYSLAFRKRKLFYATMKAAAKIYNSGFDSNGIVSSSRDGSRIKSLWLEIGLRVIALGAPGVRIEEWEAVRYLILQMPLDAENVFNGKKTPWIRHAQIEASRANLLIDNVKNDRSGRAMLSLAHQLVEQEECLRTDLPLGDDRLLNSILQFDVLAALTAMVDAGNMSYGLWYPSFAFWYSKRSEPIVNALLTDKKLREGLLANDFDEDFLANAFRAVNEAAHHQAFTIWDGWDSNALRDFLQKHPKS